MESGKVSNGCSSINDEPIETICKTDGGNFLELVEKPVPPHPTLKLWTFPVKDSLHMDCTFIQDIAEVQDALHQTCANPLV